MPLLLRKEIQTLLRSLTTSVYVGLRRRLPIVGR